ncbi:MAG: class I SAM-dependent methyltransferase [Limisphaerales bacterium]
MSSWSQNLAAALARSPLFRRGAELYARNARDWNLPLSKLDKLQTGGWLILHDYARGLFPPTFHDQQAAYRAEKAYRSALPGVSEAEIQSVALTKPFWFGRGGRTYLRDFLLLAECFEQVGIAPPARLLELGCGSGWAAEFFATMGYRVVGTTLAEEDIADAQRRIASLAAKGLRAELSFIACPMESVHQHVERAAFDGVFVYEALHHAFDWRETLRSAHACLRPGGWLLIGKEPNVLHTCISYRVARLSNTHEIGFRRGALVAGLRAAGFGRIISRGARLHFWARPHWLLAQKTS